MSKDSNSLHQIPCIISERECLISLELDKEEKILQLSVENLAPEFIETRELLKMLIGSPIHKLSKSLSSQSSFLNPTILIIIQKILDLQGTLNISLQNREELICRCFGVTKKQVLEDEKGLGLAGSGCGTCLKLVSRIYPSDQIGEFGKLISADSSFQTPIEYHLQCSPIITNYLDEKDLLGIFETGVGQTLYLKLSTNKLFNPYQISGNLELLIKKETGILPEVLISLID